MHCGDWSILSCDGCGVKLFPLKCRSWLCEGCFEYRLWRLKNLARSGNPSTFITLTCSQKHYPNPNEGARALVQAWRNIIQRAAREGLMTNCQYLCVFEETEEGWPHLHILARMPYLDQAWISERMDEYMNSPVCWISEVKSQKHAAWYVSKYISKGPGRFDGCKRYWTSQGWNLTKQTDEDKIKPAGSWSVIVMQTAASLARRLAGLNWVVEKDDTEYAYTGRPGLNASWPIMTDGYGSRGLYPPWESHCFDADIYSELSN